MIMCTFKMIAVSNMELYQSAHGACTLDLYAEYLAQLVTSLRPDMLIVREKNLSEEAYLELFTTVWEICGNGCENASVLIPHSYFSAAEKTGSSCIHLPLHLLRDYQGKEELAGISHIGVSVHAVEEAKEAEQLGAAYVTAGHIFSTNCKPGVPPRGIAFLEQVCGSVNIPVYAIGGIHPENLSQIQDSGAAGACMMSEYMC